MNPSTEFNQETLLRYFHLGTKWCGLDDIAESYDDLGVNIKTDKCCRSHDVSCPIRIKSFQRKYGLSNWSWKTSSHCNCEIHFKKCLLKVSLL